MPQDSIAYAVGRVRAQARKPLGEAQMERLLSASSYQEALRLLSELGWPEVHSGDVEALSVRMLEQLSARLREISPQPELTDAFLLRHDAQNLKALFKARILHVKPEGISASGTIPLSLLQHAVNERDYKKFPPVFEQVMNTLEKKTALHVNPMEIDVEIDRALYGEIARRMKATSSRPAQLYFQAKVDFLNAIALLRLQAMAQEGLRLADVLLPGGSISTEQWAQIAQKPQSLERAFSVYPKHLVQALARARQDRQFIPALEKAVDDYLIGLFRPYRHEPFAIEVLLGWLLAHEREAAAVRLIMAGKLNDFPEDIIRERLREAYGR